MRFIHTKAFISTTRCEALAHGTAWRNLESTGSEEARYGPCSHDFTPSRRPGEGIPLGHKAEGQLLRTEGRGR